MCGVAAGLAAPFAGSEISFNVFFGEPFEAHARFDIALTKSLLRRHQADRSVDAVIAPGKQSQALRRLVEQFRLRQNAPADGDNGVGGQNVGPFEVIVDAHHAERCFGLVAREPGGIGARQLAPLRRLVDIGGPQRVGFDADLVDKRKPARRAGGQNQFWTADHLNR